MINHPNRSKIGTPTEGPFRALRGGDKREWERPGCGFVLGPDDKVVGRFPRYADAVLFAASLDLLTALKPFAEIALLKDDDKRPGQPDMIEGPDLAITPAHVRAARSAITKAET